MHIHVGAGNGSNELEGDHRESNPCKGKIGTINENGDDDDDIMFIYFNKGIPYHEF